MATVAISGTSTKSGSFALAIGPALAAGLMVGGVECLFFAYALARTTVRLRLLGQSVPGEMDRIDTGVLVLISIATVLAGAAFAWLCGKRASWWRVALAGVSLLVTSLLGVVIAGFGEQFTTTFGLVRTFQLAFMVASGTAALLCSVAVGWLVGVPAAVRKAVLIGLVTGASYIAFALLIDQLPGWRVGGGDMAMPRVAMLGNLLSGTIGGTVAFRLFKY